MAGGAGRRKSKRQNTEEEGSAGEGGRGEITEWRATLVYFRGLISESQGHKCNCSHMEMLPTVEARHAPQLTDASTRKRVEDLKTQVAARLSSLYGPPQISPSTAPETQPVEPAIPILGNQNWNSVKYPGTITQRPRDIASLRAHTTAGLDHIPARLLWFLVPCSTEELASIFAGIVTGADIPDHWQEVRVALILK